MIRICTQFPSGQQWIERYRGGVPRLALVLGFTATGLLPGISAAGATPAHRRYTAIADAEFLINGPQPHPKYPLPPLEIGVSPTLISRAVIAALGIPVDLFNAGLPQAPAVFAHDLGGTPAACLTTGSALPLATVRRLLTEGMHWGEHLGQKAANSYLLIGECVVGGTTTALSLLLGLGIDAMGKVNSSHPNCNHGQKREVVQAGLQQAGLIPLPKSLDPLAVVAAVGDPMQVAVAGMALAASRFCGVMLAGGTQMLAVYALMRSLASSYSLPAHLERVVVGTTRWVAEDPTSDAVGLAQEIGDIPMLATELSFAQARYPQLQVYEQGYVKEGVGAGGCAIAAHLQQGWTQAQLVSAIEALVERYARMS